MTHPYTADYFQGRRMSEAMSDPFNTRTRALKGYRRGARMLGDLSHKRLLDVGCGLGAGAWLLAAKGAHVVGVDVSEEATEWARLTYEPEADKLGFHIEFWTVDLLANTGTGLGSFDAITVVDVLEHFTREQGKSLMESLGLLLKPGGKMFLHVPVTANALDWALTAKNGLLPRRIKGNVLDHHGDPTHAHRYSVRALARLLKATRWTTERVELRAYNKRLPLLESAIGKGKWRSAEKLQEQVVTDWDAIHSRIPV